MDRAPSHQEYEIVKDNEKATNRMEPRTIQVGDTKLAYLEAGRRDGRLALLLHGFPDTPYGWQATMETLAHSGFWVVAPFNRGYAPSEKGSAPPTLNVLASDVLGLVSALGRARADVLVGHDWGVSISTCAASMAPERFERLVLVGVPHPNVLQPTPTILWRGRHYLNMLLPGAQERFQRNDLAGVDALYRQWSPGWNYGPDDTAAVKANLSDPETLRAAIGYYRANTIGVVTKAMKRPIPVPTLGVAGLDETLFPLKFYQAAKRMFSASYELVCLRGGHYVHRESPQAFSSHLVRFVS